MTWHFLRPGVGVQAAVGSIEDLLRGVKDIEGASDQDVRLSIHRYLLWTERAEKALLDHLDDAMFSQSLFTDRYWRIRDANELSARLAPLIANEVRYQGERLSLVLNQLTEYREQLKLGDGSFLVLDTNVYVHGQAFDAVKWHERVQSAHVVILLPVVVIDELDQLKDRGGSTADAARSVLRKLDEAIADSEGRHELRSSVSVHSRRTPGAHTSRSTGRRDRETSAIFFRG